MELVEQKLKYEDVEIESPQPGYVKMKHTAIGLNFIDTYFRRGQYKTELPYIPGDFHLPPKPKPPVSFPAYNPPLQMPI